MLITDNQITPDCRVTPGKMALPNQYYAGAVGSRFIVSLRDTQTILGVKCPVCNKIYVPPREYCEKDFSKMDENWCTLGNEGTVVNFTIIYQDEKHYPRRAPFVIALIKIDGADTAFAHLVDNIEPANMEIGMRVKAVYADYTTNTICDIDHFEPIN